MNFGIKHALCAAPVLMFLVSAASFAQTPGAVAAPSADNTELLQLMQMLSQVKSARNKFVERKYLKILDKPLSFSGQLAYRAPDYLEKQTLIPKPETMVLEGPKLSVESKGKRRVLALQDYPVVWAFVESIRATLAGDLPGLQRFYRVTMEGDSAQWRLLLTPTDSQMQEVVSEIRIGGRRNRVLSIEVLETQGDRSLMTISEDER